MLHTRLQKEEKELKSCCFLPAATSFLFHYPHFGGRRNFRTKGTEKERKMDYKTGNKIQTCRPYFWSPEEFIGCRIVTSKEITGNRVETKGWFLSSRCL